MKLLQHIKLVAFVFLLFLFSCRHDVVVPDSPVVSFDTDVRPVIGGNCTESGCHAASGGEFPLDDYDHVMKRVKAGDARNSDLYKSVTGKGASLMPPAPRPLLSEKDIKYIYLWIEQGAKNN